MLPDNATLRFYESFYEQGHKVVLLLRMKRRADRTLFSIAKAVAAVSAVSSGSSDDDSSNDSYDICSSFDQSGISSDASGSISSHQTGNSAVPSDFVWQNQDNLPVIHPFTGVPGVKANFSSTDNPIDFFHAFITPEIIDIIVEETNKYAFLKSPRRNPFKKRHDISWSDVSAGEIRAVFGLCLLMGVVQKPVMKQYWSTQAMIQTPFFREVMPRDRFQQILANLHFADNEKDNGNDRLFKIRHVTESIITNFREVYVPNQNISTDESLLKFHGRLGFKQYNPSKRARFGIKVYKVCESSGSSCGYIWNMKIYCGQDRTDDGCPVSTKIVMDLNEQILGKGYNIYLDNWYSSPNLFVKLHENNTNVCGTVRLNRKNMPPDFSKVKLKRGEVAFRSSNKGILALKWHDKKEVKMLSTMHTAKMINTGKKNRKEEPIIKPECVLAYNRGMGGVDRSDQRASTYRSVRKSVKWYKKLFFYIMDMCVVNSYLVHNEVGGPKCSLLEFRMKLVSNLIESATLPTYRKRGRPQSLDSPARLLGKHFPVYIPSTDKKEKPQRRCVVCSAKGLRKDTRYQCDVCELSLCVVPCFRDYHTKADY